MNFRKTWASLLAFCILLMFGIGNVGALSSSNSIKDIACSYLGIGDVGSFCSLYGVGDVGALYQDDLTASSFSPGIGDIGAYIHLKGVGDIGS